MFTRQLAVSLTFTYQEFDIKRTSRWRMYDAGRLKGERFELQADGTHADVKIAVLTHYLAP